MRVVNQSSHIHTLSDEVRQSHREMYYGMPFGYTTPAAPSTAATPISLPQQPPSEENQSPNMTELMNELKNTYKNIQFDFISFSKTDQIKNYASSKKGLNHVALSPKLLEKMAADEELKNQVKNILNQMNDYRFSSKVQAELMDKELTGMGLILDENGDVSKWTAMEEKKKDDFSWAYQKKEEKKNSFYENKKKKENPYTTPYKYSHSQSMMRLANAKNVSSVRGLMAQKQGEISKVKQQVKDPVEAAKIIRRIKSLIQSGNIKIARLHKEERICKEKRAAARRIKFKQEQRLAEELRKKRTARKAQEHCQTASFDDIFVKPSVNDYMYKQITDSYKDTMSGYADGALGMSGVSGVPVGAPVAPAAPVAEVTVTPIVSIDCSA